MIQPMYLLNLVAADDVFSHHAVSDIFAVNVQLQTTLLVSLCFTLSSRNITRSE